MSYVWLNGDLKLATEAAIPVQDRGFSLGDGLFETLAVTGGEIQFFAEHVARLCASAKVLGITCLVESEDIKKHCLMVLTKNKLLNQDAALRITLTRGVSARGIEIDESAQPLLLISASAYHQPAGECQLRVSSIKRSSFGLCSHHKTLNYLENILARQQAKQAGFDDALLLNEKGELVCASVANIFFKKGKEVYTPALACGALAGVMRQAVIDAYKSKDIAVHETKIYLRDLEKFTACFVTNSLIGRRGVSVIDLASEVRPQRILF